MSALLLFLAAAQDDPARWVEGLRAERVEEREAAERALRKAGRSAKPALEKAAADRDAEVAVRAKRLLRILELEGLPASALAAFPNAAERFADDDHAWTEAVLRMATVPDLSLVRLRAREAGPEIARLLDDPEEDVREAAVRAVESFGLAGVEKGLLPLLRDPEEDVRSRAAEALARRGVREAAPVLLRLEQNLWPLNGIRQPELWRKLAGTPFRGDWKESHPRELFREVARQAGLRLEADRVVFTYSVTAPWCGTNGFDNWPDLAPDPPSLLRVLELADEWDKEIVLEKDAIRLLPPDEALDFWKEWHSGK